MGKKTEKKSQKKVAVLVESFRRLFEKTPTPPPPWHVPEADLMGSASRCVKKRSHKFKGPKGGLGTGLHGLGGPVDVHLVNFRISHSHPSNSLVLAQIQTAPGNLG